VTEADFATFDYIFAMDKENKSALYRMKRRAPAKGATLKLFGEFSGTNTPEEIDDPYYGGDAGFETVYQQALRFSKNFLTSVFPEQGPEGEPISISRIQS
jgi:low molecular weight phosphotyrosine protein phosphatase